MTTRMPYRAPLPSPRTAKGLDSVPAVVGAPGSTTEHARVVEAADAELAAALRELRELASGLDPTTLREHGLRRAIELLVERTPFPVRVDAPPHRLAEQVERAAYYIVSEALANASKHAEPTEATILVACEEGSLSLEIRDDGTGGADLAGTGIAGMRDRAEALGGILAVESPSCGGTTVRAVLPIAGPRERSSHHRGGRMVHARGRRLGNG